MERITVLISHIQAIGLASEVLLTWAISLLGGSIYLIVKPNVKHISKRFKLVYLFFIPAWIFAVFSVYYANIISRRIPAAERQRVNTDQALKIVEYIAGEANKEYGLQLLYFQIALGFFSIWLLFYLLHWIFSKEESQKTKNEKAISDFTIHLCIPPGNGSESQRM